MNSFASYNLNNLSSIVMTLPRAPKKKSRPISVTVRLSVSASDQLKILAKDHDLSQADVVEHLVMNEFKKWQKSKKSE